MRAALTAAALLLLAASPAAAAGDEPIDDLQRLFIEDTVALIHPPSAAAGAAARALMDRAGKARARGDFVAMRRDLAEARVVLAGGSWNGDTAFVHSLGLHPQHRVIDPAEPLTIAVRQWFYAPSPARQLDLRFGLRGRGRAAVVWQQQSGPAGMALLRWGRIVLPALHDVPDGTYDLILEARDGARVIGQTTQTVWIAAGLRRDLTAIARGKAGLTLAPGLAATLAWPADLARTLDDGSRQAVEVDWRGLLDRTLALLAEAEAGRDPLVRAPGLHERHYASAVSHRIEPYALFVPTVWDGQSALPLVVLLHGSNGDHNRAFASGKVARLAEARGWAVLSPMGYSPNSGWGNHLPVVLANGTMPEPRPSTIAGRVLRRNGVDPEPAEADVLAALAAVRKDLPIDPAHIWLAGNSMGGEGVWHLGQRHPGLWAAIAPGAGAIDPAHYPYPRLGQLPVMAVHGDADNIISYDASANMIARLNHAGGKGTLLTVNGGGHGSFETVLDQIFDFFATHPREDRP